MKPKIIKTADGSTTLYLEDWNEHYHSKHGAIQEAQHVFIEKGLFHALDLNKRSHISILEMGFGTGLNALLTAFEAEKQSVKINYTGIEGFPLESEITSQLNYSELLSNKYEQLFRKIHAVSWESEHEISPNFFLTKNQLMFEDISFKDQFDLIYFDAFGSRVQPDLWERSMLEKMYTALKSKGVFVTYAAKGSVRRCLAELGFKVERLEGPPGKRHMLRAEK